MIVLPLAEDSLHSGIGERRAYLLYVYYDPKAEAKVLRAVQTACGFDLSEKEAEIVDPESDWDLEQDIMLRPGNVCHYSTMMYEVIPEGCRQPDRVDGHLFPGIEHGYKPKLLNYKKPVKAVKA